MHWDRLDQRFLDTLDKYVTVYLSVTSEFDQYTIRSPLVGTSFDSSLLLLLHFPLLLAFGLARFH